MFVGDHLAPYFAMLRAAFPVPPEGDDRRALLHVLFFDLSERALARLLSEYFDDERAVVLNEAIEVVNGPSLDPDLLGGIRSALEAEGWDFDAD